MARVSDTIELDGRRLAIERIQPQRKEPTLVFLHEGLGSIAQWRDFPALLCESTGLPGLVYDRLGYGQSDPLERPFSARFLHDEALVALPRVLELTGVEDAYLVGHSDGASIALIFAGANPGVRLRGVIAEAPHLFVEDLTVSSIRALAHSWRTTDLPRRLARYHGEKTEALFQAWADVWLSEEFRSFDIHEYVPSIRCPILALQGEDDEYGTPEQLLALRAAATVPAIVKLLPGCAHAPHHQARAATLELMHGFATGTSR
jgi:pimeloyl-ACP methyl ester carboxylesterase